MDETAVKFWQDGGAGYVKIPANVKKAEFLETETKASLSKRRMVCSLLGFISDDEETQRLLPQVLVVNKRSLTEAATREVQASLQGSDTLFLKRRDSAWVSVDLMVEIIHLLAKCLEPVKPLAHILLLLDCAPIHTTQRVVAAVARAGFLLHFVPALMTSVLQPLDVYAFAQYKKVLRDYYEERAMASDTGEVSNKEVVDITFKAATAVLQSGAWRHAFRGCGWGESQQGIGRRASRRLQWTKEEARCPSEFPTLQQLQTVWGDRRTIPVGWLFHCARALASADAFEVVHAPLPNPVPPVPAPHPWFGRLRSSSRERSPSPVAGPPAALHPPPAWRPPSPVRPKPRPLPLAAAAAADNSLPRPPLPPPARPPPVGRPLLLRKRSREAATAASTSGSPS